LLVTTWNGLRLAFPVDEVHGIHRLPQDQLKTPPAMISNPERFRGYTQAVFSWRDRTVGLLDADSFFDSLNRCLA
jgi:chemotaxis-related protein WspD